MEQRDSERQEGLPPETEQESTDAQPNLADVLPLQQGSLPQGGDFSSPEPVGGSKRDPVSQGPNVEDTIAGRN